ncbi:MAG TPA: DUF2795 domain-containing protein, partial [Ktedonobacteraceae bacterium]
NTIMAKVSPIQVEKYLKGLDYPVSKAELVKYAQQHGADESIMAALQKLPNKTFDSPTMVSKAISEVDRGATR